MHSDQEVASPSEEHEKTAKELHPASVSPNLDDECEKSSMHEKPPKQSYSLSDSTTTGEEHKIATMELVQEDASLDLGGEHEKSPKQSDPASVSLSLDEGQEISPQRSDYASFPLNHNVEHQEREHLSDTEDSFKLSDEYQKAVDSIKKKRKRSPEIANISRDHTIDESTGSPSNQLVLYDHSAIDAEQGALVTSDGMDSTPTFRNFLGSHSAGRVAPSIGAFTVQCATCFKWRLIPTKEKYEKIRETILQDPFTCERAREWRPDITCDDPTDISQDGSRIWAIDKPNIAQPPAGWERILRIRGEGGTKFADVYYAAPSGKRLRSMVEIQRYLLEHPEYIRQGVTLSQFSFQIPRPLQEDYVRKRPPPQGRLPSGSDAAGMEYSSPLEPEEVNPISWAAPPTQSELESGGPDYLASYSKAATSSQPLQPSPSRPTKLKITMSSTKQKYNSPLVDKSAVKLEGAE